MNQYNEISTLQYLGSKARIISHICDPKLKTNQLEPSLIYLQERRLLAMGAFPFVRWEEMQKVSLP